MNEYDILYFRKGWSRLSYVKEDVKILLASKKSFLGIQSIQTEFIIASTTSGSFHSVRNIYQKKDCPTTTHASRKSYRF